ncbi:MAG: hypothetical protein H5T63_04955 [Chloroflexi bacterium]|nr:hypothetical protein [Chloroflexota bacterium]
MAVYMQDRACLFGQAIDGAMCVNPLGEIVREEWLCAAGICREMRPVGADFVIVGTGFVIVGADFIIVGAGSEPAPTGHGH